MGLDGIAPLFALDKQQNAQHTSVERQLVLSACAVLPIAAAGLSTHDASGELSVSTWTSQQARTLQLVQLNSEAGPGVDAYRNGSTITVDDVAIDDHRWPDFAKMAAEFGVRSVYSVPLRNHPLQIGVLDLYCTEVKAIDSKDIAVGQTLANVAAIGLLQKQSLRNAELLCEQLQTALETRVIIEQAKGLLAARGSIDMQQAFDLLRSHARSTRQRLTQLAQEIVDGADTTEILKIRTPADQREKFQTRRCSNPR